MNSEINSTFKKECSSHFIRTAVLRELVLATISEICGYVRSNEAEFVEKNPRSVGSQAGGNGESAQKAVRQK